MITRRGAGLDELEALYRSRFDVFARVAASVTGDVERARDVVQDAFATALRKRSTPEAGELVVSYDGRPELSGFPGRFVPVNQVRMYADGRVIWRREGGPFGVDEAGIGEVKTGFLERRLTPEGLERLRSELLSTGLFDHDRYLESAYGLVWGGIQVRAGDRLASVIWCCGGIGTASPLFRDRATVATHEQAIALSRLTELLAYPASGLGASEWADDDVRAYVPSRYAICYWGYEARSLEPSPVLSRLPAGARDLLRGKDRRYDVFSSPLWEDVIDPSVVCSEVTTDEARAVAEIFNRTGFEHVSTPTPDSPSDPAFNGRFRVPDPVGTIVSFEPILPHGQWEAMGG